MTKTPQPVWLVRVRSGGLRLDRFFTDLAKADAFADKNDQYGYAVTVIPVPALGSYQAFSAFMRDAA